MHYNSFVPSAGYIERFSEQSLSFSVPNDLPRHAGATSISRLAAISRLAETNPRESSCFDAALILFGPWWRPSQQTPVARTAYLTTLAKARVPSFLSHLLTTDCQ